VTVKFIVNDHVVLLRALDGPLAPHIVSFSKWVIGQGYAPCSLRRRIRIAADFSRWLAENSGVVEQNCEPPTPFGISLRKLNPFVRW
jgi:integrase/recombinase XerD